MTIVAIDRTNSNLWFPPAGADRNVIPVWAECDISATDVDATTDAILLVGPMPANSYFPNTAGALWVKLTDMDTGGPSLDIDFGFGAGADGILDFTLINSAGGGGAAGNYASAVVAGQDPWIDVSGLYVIADVITAATTEAAGTIEVGFLYSQNVLKDT